MRNAQDASLKPYRKGVDALKAIAHPVRTRLLMELAAHGPSTATVLGEWIGESSGVTSYHLRLLAKYRMVEEAPELGKGRDRWWRRYGGPIHVGDGVSPVERTAGVLASVTFETANAEFIRDATASADDLPLEWRTLAGSSTRWLWLTPAELAELDSATAALLAKYVQANDPAARHPDLSARRVFVNHNLFPVIDETQEES